MTARRFISRFSPNRTAPEDLERIHVQRHALLDEAVDLVRESARTKNKHHLLFVGSRGCGKTHLLALINHRLGKQADLGNRLRIAWLNEDETSTSFLDLLVRIYQALSARYPDEFPKEEVEKLFGDEPDKAREAIGESLVRHAGKRTILVLVENLDGIFRQFDEGEQRTWRSFIQNHPIFATVATAQALFAGVSEQDQPFYGFFDTRHLQRLTADEATELLRKIALINGDADLEAFLKTPRGRARIRAIHHLSHGNHRLYVVLSELITKESLDELVRPFEEMVDEQLTPYYQERLRWLSPLQRKIVELLCQRGQPIAVKDIADRLFASHSTITPQLKNLREMGYVLSTPRGRESLYELAEPLMRLSMQVKDTPRAEPLGVIIDFLRVWYEPNELADRLANADPTERIYAYLQAALAKLQSGEPNLRHEIMRSELNGVSPKNFDDQQFEQMRVLAEESNRAQDWLKYGLACRYRNQQGASTEALTKAIVDCVRVIDHPNADPSDVARARAILVILLLLLDRWEAALKELPNILASGDHLLMSGTSGVLINELFRYLLFLLFDRLDLPKRHEVRVKDIVEIFASHRAMNYLGDALVRHVSDLAASPIRGEVLQQWLAHWESAAGEHEAMRLPVRLLRVGIDYLASQPRDEGKLLQLPEEERSLLRQALSLPKG